MSLMLAMVGSYIIIHHTSCSVDGLLGGAFLIASKNKSAFRIIGIACVKEWQRKGVGSYLLTVAIEEAKRCGYKKIETRSKEGAEFYCRKGFDVAGMKGQDYLLTLNI